MVTSLKKTKNRKCQKLNDSSPIMQAGNLLQWERNKNQMDQIALFLLLLPTGNLPQPSTQKKEKKKNSHVILSFTINFIWRLTNSIWVILCALHSCCREEKGGGLPVRGINELNFASPCPARWKRAGAE